MMLSSGSLVLVLLLAGAAPQQAGLLSTSADTPSAKQAVTQQQPQSETAVDPDELPVSLDRIQRALSHPPAIRVTDGGRPVFRVEVFGKKPNIEDILGPDYLKGPVPNSGMTHQEFLNMVTPKDVQGYAAFTNAQGLVVAATSVALQWALAKAIQHYKEAHTERAQEAARKEVQDALEALRKARRDAGLPDK
jgi:hypothetical protein